MAALLSDAARDLDALGSPDIAEPIQASVQAVASVPIVAAVTGTSDSWKLLRDRLDIILKWGDAIAEVCYVLAPSQNVFSLPQIFSQVHPYINLAWGVVSAAYKVRSYAIYDILYLTKFVGRSFLLRSIGMRRSRGCSMLWPMPALSLRTRRS